VAAAAMMARDAAGIVAAAAAPKRLDEPLLGLGLGDLFEAEASPKADAVRRRIVSFNSHGKLKDSRRELCAAEKVDLVPFF
jgi:hypothetical protein